MAADKGKVLKAVAMVVTGLACKTKCRAVYQPKALRLKILDELSPRTCGNDQCSSSCSEWALGLRPS
jgi:hypothetical protein